jgi:hypothetical protein
MFARSTAFRLKPNCLAAFTRAFEDEVLPILMQEAGFQEEITFPTSPTGTDVIAISLWDTRKQAEAYKTVGYPEAIESLCKVLDGAPKVWVSDVIISTIRQTASVAAS